MFESIANGNESQCEQGGHTRGTGKQQIGQPRELLSHDGGKNTEGGTIDDDEGDDHGRTGERVDS